MKTQIIDGRKISNKIKEDLRLKISEKNITPKLAIILAGDDEASLIYVKNKQKSAKEIGIETKLFHLPTSCSEEKITNIIEDMNNDPDINGIIVQLPLPEHLNTNRIINKISPLKDVDGFHPYNTGILQNNEKPYFVAATPLGIMTLIKEKYPNLTGKNVVIIGASLIVGRPLATLLLNQECTVTITHIHTKNIKDLTQKADILVAACGVANLVKKDWIKRDAILIDVGINRLNGKICGDIDFEDIQDYAKAITPVPGGVGPMTIAMLLQNTYEGYILQHTSV